MDIELTIGRLVLDGLDVDNGTAALVASALETELGRLLSREPTRQAMRHETVPTVRTAPLSLPAGAGPQATGRHIAAAVMGGLNRG